MKKIHLLEDGGPRCKPNSSMNGLLVTEESANVTCLHCRKALGLSVTTLKMSSRHARLTLRLPNGRACRDVLLEGFRLRVVETEPGTQDRDSYINFEPPPVELEVRLTESGYTAIRELFLKLPTGEKQNDK